MDIQVAKFREVLALLKPAVGRKTTIKSLESIMLKDGKAIATNLDTMVVLGVPEADITTLVPFADMVKLLAYVPGNQRLHLEVKDDNLSLAWTDGSASFPVLDIKTFPNVPEFVPKFEESLDTDILIPALASVLPYAATESDRPVLQGVTLILGTPVEVAAGDGYRMATKALALEYPENVVTVMPPNSVTVLKHLWEKTPRTPPQSDDMMEVVLSKKYARVGYDGETGLRVQFEEGTTAIIKLVSGKPPDWLKLIPKGKPSLKLSAMAPDLERAVRRVMGVAQEGKGIVRFAFEDESATISAKNDGHEVKSSIHILNCMGAPNKVALNVTYLLSYLNGKQGIVTLSWTGKKAPVTFQAHNEPKVLIMPMDAKD